MGFDVALTFQKSIKCWLCQRQKWEQINILYQTPSIPKVKASIITLAYNIKQGKDESEKRFVVVLTWVCLFNELHLKGRTI